MRTVLAVDLGKTGCRAALWPAGAGAGVAPLASATGPGAPGLAERDGLDDAFAALSATCAGLGEVTPPESVAVGAAGVVSDPHAAHRLAHRLQQSWSGSGTGPGTAVVVASDAATSHAGALGGRPGVVLAAGTGAVALGVDRAGRSRRVDGWGPWLGDDGSGAWLGRAGLHAALAALDGRGPATALTDAARAVHGDDLSVLPSVIGGHDEPVRALAAFAPAVARTAATGDAIALGLLERAAEALAHAVVTAARALATDSSLEPVPAALTGGLLCLGEPLLGPLTARLLAAGDLVALEPAAGCSLDGARLLAEHADTVHESALTRLRAGGGR